MPDTKPAATGMADLLALLGQIRDRNEQYIQAMKLTEWSVSQEPCGDVRRLLAVADAVLELHAPGYPVTYPEPSGQPTCGVCHAGGWDWDPEKWPCPTVQAVSDALLGETRSDGESGWADTGNSHKQSTEE